MPIWHINNARQRKDDATETPILVIQMMHANKKKFHGFEGYSDATSLYCNNHSYWFDEKCDLKIRNLTLKAQNFMSKTPKSTLEQKGGATGSTFFYSRLKS